ncbi:hypothetical protein [Pseudomonas jessenii]|uniref:hypothetical protein n=1 Tax=Pseudomonas jessenii TaxID=77298 RepID=UPI003892B863
MHPNTQDFVVNQALLVRLAKEDNIERDCFYGRPDLQPVGVGRHDVVVFKERASANRSLPYGGGSGFLVSDPWRDLSCITKARSFLSDLPTSPAEELSFQLMLKTARFSDNADSTKISAWFIGTHIVGVRSTPDYGNAFARLRDFENEESDWDGMDGQPADGCTVQAVRLLLDQVRELNISRPSLTLSNNGAVSVIWKDDTRFATLKFKGKNQYSAIVLVDRKPFLTMNCSVSQLPQKLQIFLIESFREDVTAHLSELPNGLR